MITEEEIQEIAAPNGVKLTDGACRTIVFYMIGYLHHHPDRRFPSENLECVRRDFYNVVKRLSEGKHLV